MSSIAGFATPQGTQRFQERFRPKVASGHFRPRQGLLFSSIGAGSYLGDPDSETDRLYEVGIREALSLGVNVLDSAINYRAQRSERVIGKVLEEEIASGRLGREEVILCTKGGFLPFDGDYPTNPHQYFKTTYLDSGILSPEEIAGGCHAMSPKYLEDQLNRSLQNLGVGTIDIYYVHNPETQLTQISRSRFMERLQEAFRFLEKQVVAGKIRMYGTATWVGYRIDAEELEYLSLQEIEVLAREVGGKDHHFRAVQLPINVAMPEAWIYPNQGYGAAAAPFLEVADKMNLVVAASASLLQGQLAAALPAQWKEIFSNLERQAQWAIQFVRSCPGVTTALVGMKQVEHVRENLKTAAVAPLSSAQLTELFKYAN